MNRKYFWTEDDAQRFWDTYEEEHLSLERLSESINVSRNRIQWLFKKHSLPIRSARSTYDLRYDFSYLTDIERGYLAGLVDGEGYIDVTGNSLRLTIANTDYNLMLYLKGLLGCGSIQKCTKGKIHWNQGYTYNLCAAQVRQLLKIIRPYLIIKKDKVHEIYATH